MGGGGVVVEKTHKAKAVVVLGSPTTATFRNCCTLFACFVVMHYLVFFRLSLFCIEKNFITLS